MTQLFTRLPELPLKLESLIDLLRDRALNQGDKQVFTFVQDGHIETDWLTYQQLDTQAQAIASVLQTLRFTDQRALLLYLPGLEFIKAFFGCLYAQVIAVPAYPPRRNQNFSRLEAILADAQVGVVLTTQSLLQDIESQFAQNPEIGKVQWLVTDTISSDRASSWKQPKVTQDHLAFLQYTSGSTGKPKGVMVSHGNILHNSAAIYNFFAHTYNSQGVIWLPPYHDMGLIGGVLQPVYAGFPVTLMSPVDFLQKPYRWLKAISRYKATTSGGPNFAYDLCIRKIKPEQKENLDLSSWKLAFSGAEPVRAETLELFAKTFASNGFRKEAFYPCYGMAETTLIITGGLKPENLPNMCHVEAEPLERNLVVTNAKQQTSTREIVSVGQTILDQKVVIVDPESLTECANNQVGEIWVSGSSVTKGYWNQTEQTKQSFHAYLKDTGAGPYLRTGDLGFLQDGELFITGRLKDLIIIRGQNHYPQDIEFTVENCHPAIRVNCGAVFSVELKGEERIVIVYEVEREYLRKLNVNEVLEKIRNSVTAEHGLQVYAVLLVKTGSIPKTSSGKVQRHACKIGFINGSLNVVEDWSENPQFKTKFQHLESEIECVFQELKISK